MSEECRPQARGPPSSRAATASGSDDPKSIGKRSRGPANSTGVSLQGWRRYARYWPWPRGRHGRGRGPQGMSPMEVAQFMSRIPRASRVVPQIVEEGITTKELGPPPKQPAWLGVGSDCQQELEDSDSKAEDSRLEEGLMEEPVAGEAANEINLAKGSMDEPVADPRTAVVVTEEPLAGNAGDEMANKELRTAEGGLKKPMAGKTDAEIALAKRWCPHRYPVYPRTGVFQDFLKYNNESKTISKLNKPGMDRIKNLPIWEGESDHETEASMNVEEKNICLKAGESTVAVSSVGPGHDNTGFYCTGTIISCQDDRGTVRILTSSGILYDDDGKLHSLEQKVSVKLSNGLKCEGKVLFVNMHYNIAILEVCVGSSMLALRFGSMPRYGQRVIVLGRDSVELFLRVRLISTLQRTALGRTHYMFPKSADGFPVICTGGPVIDEDGAMVGIITCHVPEAAMMSISIVKICLDMWENHSCIARPEINMSLRTVQLLPLKTRDILQCIYKKHSGFVIDGVEYDSTPEKVGIRRGDIIDIVDEKCGSTLPELETYLLSQALRFLPITEGSSLTQELELKIRVHDLVHRSSTDTQLPIPVVCEVALPGCTLRGSS